MTTSIKPGLYKHFKGILVYVLGVSFDTETEKEYVVYMHLGEDSKKRINGLWHRPIEMFLDMKEVNGELVQRFVPVE